MTDVSKYPGITIPSGLSLPQFPSRQEDIYPYLRTLHEVLSGMQAANARAFDVLNYFRIMMPPPGDGLSDLPDASGSGAVYFDRATRMVYFDPAPESGDTPEWIPITIYPLTGDDTFWDDATVEAQVTRPGSSAPTWTNVTGNVSTYVFTNNQNNFVEFNKQIPHSYLEESSIYPHVHWGSMGTNTGDVRWQLDYAWADIDDVFNGSTQIATVDAGSGVALTHQVIGFGAITPPASKGKISSELMCKLTRTGNHLNDTLTDDAAFFEFDFHIEMNTPGSNEEYIK